MPAPERSVEDFLMELEAERARLDFMIADIRRRLGREGETPVTVPGLPGKAQPTASSPGVIRPDEFFQMSVPEAIKRYLAIMKKPQTPKAIEMGLREGGILTEAKNFYASIFTALKRLRDAGAVVNVTKGWGLTEWYEGRSLANAKHTPKKRRGKNQRGQAKKVAKRTVKPSTKQQSRREPGPGEQKPEEQRPQTYKQFLSEKMRAGMSMKDAAAEWSKLTQSG